MCSSDLFQSTPQGRFLSVNPALAHILGYADPEDMAAVFLAQATNTPLDLSHQLYLLSILLLTSKGAAAVSGGGFITLAATLQTVGTIPVASLTLLLGVDRFMSEARAITNMIGNGIATIVVAKWEKALDEDKLQAVLAGTDTEYADDPEDMLILEESAEAAPATVPVNR